MVERVVEVGVSSYVKGWRLRCGTGLTLVVGVSFSSLDEGEDSEWFIYEYIPTFVSLLGTDQSSTIHENNFQTLAIELYKNFDNLSPDDTYSLCKLIFNLEKLWNGENSIIEHYGQSSNISIIISPYSFL